jgi:hypothetical protein
MCRVQADEHGSKSDLACRLSDMVLRRLPNRISQRASRDKDRNQIRNANALWPRPQREDESEQQHDEAGATVDPATQHR